MRTVWFVEVDRPTLVLGSTQPDGVVDRGRAAAAGVDVVRRRSGGGAVLLRPGETVWVDVLVPAGDPLAEPTWAGPSAGWDGRGRGPWPRSGVAGAAVHEGRPRPPSRWSAAVCFAGLGPGEVTVGGAKVVGISQRRTRAGVAVPVRRPGAVGPRSPARPARPADDERRRPPPTSARVAAGTGVRPGPPGDRLRGRPERRLTGRGGGGIRLPPAAAVPRRRPRWPAAAVASWMRRRTTLPTASQVGVVEGVVDPPPGVLAGAPVGGDDLQQVGGTRHRQDQGGAGLDRAVRRRPPPGGGPRPRRERPGRGAGGGTGPRRSAGRGCRPAPGPMSPRPTWARPACCWRPRLMWERMAFIFGLLLGHHLGRPGQGRRPWRRGARHRHDAVVAVAGAGERPRAAARRPGGRPGRR